jgi:hypothetical protein
MVGMKLSANSVPTEASSLLEEGSKHVSNDVLEGSALAAHQQIYLITVLFLASAVIMSYIIGPVLLGSRSSELWGTISGALKIYFYVITPIAAIANVYNNFWYLQLDQVAYRSAGRLSFIKPQTYFFGAIAGVMATSIFYMPLSVWAINSVHFLIVCEIFNVFPSILLIMNMFFHNTQKSGWQWSRTGTYSNSTVDHGDLFNFLD